MFPNPQDALPLPLRPNLEQYRKLAKDLSKACRSGPDALHEWLQRWIERLVKSSGIELTLRLPEGLDRWIKEVNEFARQTLSEQSCAVTAAQFVIARSHGFASWPKFAHHLEELEAANSPAAQFEAAVDAIVAGDDAKLELLLRENPALIRVRSSREHRATLLHYVSANGVEGYRQRTPRNAVEIAKILRHAGAEVDATCDVYHGDCTTLGLVATSVHPEKAGVQEELMQLLLDWGASMGRLNLAGNSPSLVVACLANGRPKAARFLADRGAPLDLEAAAGSGKLDAVESFFHADGSLKATATRQQLQRGFLWACMAGHDDVVEFLLAHGADLRDQAGTGEPPLQMAVVGARLSTINLLLAHGAPLEELNVYGGTALGQAGWSFSNGDPDTDYVAIFETLLTAGAKLESGWLAWLENQKRPSPKTKARMAAVLRRYGATN